MPPVATDLTVRRIRFWEHGRAVGQMFRDYPPGADLLMDQIRSAGFLTYFALRYLFAPVYFAREQGWAIRGERGEMAAIMYLARGARQGIRVMHIDDINVSARYRGRGLAERLMALAEELARAEQRPFLKLAVTVTNTPAVTLYRRLGYQEQHHRFFTFVPSSAAMDPPLATALTLRPLGRRQAAKAFRRFYQMEVEAGAPAVASMLVAYYPHGAPRGAKRLYALEQGGQQIGCGAVYRRGAQWNVDLSLRPDVWGSDVERQAIRLLTRATGEEHGSAIALRVPSAAHFDALRSGANPLASALGLMEQSDERMIMVKCLALAS